MRQLFTGGEGLARQHQAIMVAVTSTHPGAVRLGSRIWSPV